jgi:hypothetical protein
VPRRKAPSVKIRGVRITDRSAYYQVAPGVLLPRGFEATVDDPSLPYLVELEIAAELGQIWCASVRARGRAEGVAVTSEGIRKLPINRLVRLVSSVEVNRQLRYPLGVTRLIQQEPNIESVVPARREILRATGARRELTPEFLKQVADVWHSAPNPRARTKAVADHFGTVRENARKWVRAAQDKDFISEEER